MGLTRRQQARSRQLKCDQKSQSYYAVYIAGKLASDGHRPSRSGENETHAPGYGIMPVREAALFAERRGMWNTTQHTAPGERTLVGLFGVPVPGPWPLLESLPWAVSLYLRRSALATPCWVRDS